MNYSIDSNSQYRNRYILNAQHGYRIAVIMNEVRCSGPDTYRIPILKFSSSPTAPIWNVRVLHTARLSYNTYPTLPYHLARTINVTSEDNPNERSEEILELANGCLCCSIKDSGIASIEKLLKRRGFDYIL